ncbi:MAG: TIGR01777 family oxidoreductase [FCB group bacterium]|jgi:uncharacterized protein (TIGR01777 family)|nr:TIGR01777 family oxidoreductase [FCB group bacterium]
MKILLTGSTGVIGSKLIPLLKKDRHHITRLVRTSQNSGAPEVLWNPREGTIDREGIEGHDAVIHLAGESIAGIWTAGKKKEIYDSRVDGTTLLAKAVAKAKKRPHTFLSASAIGYYGDRGEEVLTEESCGGEHFLSQVCQDWEKATAPARKAGIRVANLRFGIVLSRDDATFQFLTTMFKVGLGGQLGGGENYISWITVDDAVRAVKHVLMNPEISGPVNIVTPNSVRHKELVAKLGEALSRPTFLALPEFATRAVFGDIANTLLLSSMCVRPAKLQKSGFRPRHARLETALRHLLKQ